MGLMLSIQTLSKLLIETGVLIQKLRECGRTGRVGCWLAAFLDPSFRQQAVAVDGRVSTLSPVVSGGPQSTVRGPVLFLINIIDIGNGISRGTSASSFADDTLYSSLTWR